MRAYQAALKKVTKPHGHNQDYVTKATFKFLMIYMRLYYELWEDFEDMQLDGDRRISEKEFKNGYHILVSDWKLKIDDPDATFK